MKPYYEDDLVTLWHGDCAELSFVLGTADAIVTDPPYGETSLEWDSWPEAWTYLASCHTRAMWCFGSMRMFFEHASEFLADWKFSHEIVWEKQNGTGFATDKFRRIHELATFWYRGSWSDLRHEVPKVPQLSVGNKSSRSRGQTPHAGKIGPGAYQDDGTRLMTTIQFVQNEQSRAVHPTQKPLGIVAPLIEYSVPPGGTVLDLFAGSGTTLLAAKLAGRKAVGVEAREDYCEAAALRLSQQTFDFDVA